MKNATLIEDDYLRQTLATQGWKLIVERLEEAIATCARRAVDAEGAEHLKAKGRYEGLVMARDIPKTLIAERQRKQ